MSYIKSVNILTPDMIPNFDEKYILDKNGSIYLKDSYDPNAISVSSPFDSIDISEKNPNVINTKKAYDAYMDTCNVFNPSVSETIPDNPQCSFFSVMEFMRSNGISTPSFTLSNTQDFLPFLDKMKTYLNTHDVQVGSSSLPKFIDTFKANLIKYDCK